jgi:predicted transcriptional regulator of viral defense system
MDYLSFRKDFIEYGCFSIHQVFAAEQGFQRNNLSRWCDRGLLIRIRQGWYAFPEFASRPDAPFIVSNAIYKPSYISTYSALAFYGMIPEAVTGATAASTLKTASFTGGIGKFSYRRIKPSLFFGYDSKRSGERAFLIATPEKAVLDLLYLNTRLCSGEDMAELRLDPDFMRGGFDYDRFVEYADRAGSRRLSARAGKLREVYD